MSNEKTGLHQRLESGKSILIAELTPPKSAVAAPLLDTAEQYAGKVHALGIGDNRNGVRMSALAAASLAASKGVEPILHVVTRDKNRIALVSEFLGAQALGVRNFLCTSGEHQTLGPARAARNVFDIDSLLLLKTFASLDSDATIVGEDKLEAAGPSCLGATASPQADPLELQVMRLEKKVAAGAQFVVTQPIFDLDRFDAWWQEVTRRGIHEKVAIVAGIRPLADAEDAKACAEERPSHGVPDAMLERITSKADVDAQRAAGIEAALETIERLSAVEGLRGSELSGDVAIALEIIEKAGLGAD